jgi:hypothetical protein
MRNLNPDGWDYVETGVRKCPELAKQSVRLAVMGRKMGPSGIIGDE